MIGDPNLGPEIFLALVLWNEESERFHMHTGGSDPYQHNVWIYLIYDVLPEKQTKMHAQV